MNYEAKGIKTFRGMEGEGYNADLYRDGKKVAFVIDDATGGMLDVEWLDRKEEKILADHCKTLPDRPAGFLDEGKEPMMAVTPEIFIEDLVNDALLLKDAAKLTKGKIAFVDKGKMWTMKLGAHTLEAATAHVRAKHPEASILNGREPREVLAIMRALQG